MDLVIPGSLRTAYAAYLGHTVLMAEGRNTRDQKSPACAFRISGSHVVYTCTYTPLSPGQVWQGGVEIYFTHEETGQGMGCIMLLQEREQRVGSKIPSATFLKPSLTNPAHHDLFFSLSVISIVYTTHNFLLSCVEFLLCFGLGLFFFPVSLRIGTRNYISLKTFSTVLRASYFLSILN